MFFKRLLLTLAGVAVSAGASAAVSSDISGFISSSGLNSRQERAVTQYAESLDKIANIDLQSQESVISVNKEFMNAQQCLAQVYSIDQKPHMMRVSRQVYEKTFNTAELVTKYRQFLGQALQEGEKALPSAKARACK
ncbi:hypothetical protein [Succinimonas amylolytica]|uniref:hypothetical protein n=1 Tax=Succinimonas amylolytica TaxID=83769 RepID=UPI0023A79B7B